MTRFHGLPFLLSGFMTVLVGIISFVSGSSNQTVYLHMTVTLVVFYVIGLYVQKTLETIQGEIDEKNAEIEKEKMLAEESENEAEQAGQTAEKGSQSAAGPTAGQNINLTAEEQDDGFEPLTASKVIAGKINQ